MDEPRVYNRYHRNAPSGAIYIGRGTAWGNPFSHVPGLADTVLCDSRESAITEYRAQVLADEKFVELVKRHLKGKHLVCSCKPKACHGDILLEIANQED
jgi:hypothetical protein